MLLYSFFFTSQDMGFINGSKKKSNDFMFNFIDYLAWTIIIVNPVTTQDTQLVH